YVKKGQLLYLIEPDPYEAAYERAKANLLHAQAQLEKAERDWKRAERSFKAKAISEQARDAAKYAYEMAKAQVLAAKAALKQATINLGYTKVKATISGYTGLKQIDVGNLVTPGTPLVTITSVDPIYVEFSIPDVDVFKSKYNLLKGKWGEEEKKLKAKLIVNNVPYNLEGKVHFLDVKVNPNTSTVKARAVFPNPNRVLMPGQFGRIEISGLYRRNVIIVPQKAVLQTPQGSMVYVVQNGRVAPRIIKVGETSGDFFVVESGLKPGELVVVNNFFKIKPGIPVKIGEVINGRGER
ncbi:MAG: efflux RND transporter periplasmic adaptor subunit, partial [Desulfurobacteriaceae bacterium]